MDNFLFYLFGAFFIIATTHMSIYIYMGAKHKSKKALYIYKIENMYVIYLCSVVSRDNKMHTVKIDTLDIYPDEVYDVYNRSVEIIPISDEEVGFYKEWLAMRKETSGAYKIFKHISKVSKASYCKLMRNLIINRVIYNLLHVFEKWYMYYLFIAIFATYAIYDLLTTLF